MGLAETRRAILDVVREAVPGDRAYVTLLSGATHHAGDAVFEAIEPALYTEYLERWLPRQEAERFGLAELLARRRLTFLDVDLYRGEAARAVLHQEFLLPNRLAGGVGTFLLAGGIPLG